MKRARRRRTWAALPCSSCGLVRVIMLLVGKDERDPTAWFCSRCFRGEG